MLGQQAEAVAQVEAGQPALRAIDGDLGARAGAIAIDKGDVQPARIGQVGAVASACDAGEAQAEFDVGGGRGAAAPDDADAGARDRRGARVAYLNLQRGGTTEVAFRRPRNAPTP